MISLLFTTKKVFFSCSGAAHSLCAYSLLLEKKLEKGRSAFAAPESMCIWLSHWRGSCAWKWVVCLLRQSLQNNTKVRKKNILEKCIASQYLWISIPPNVGDIKNNWPSRWKPFIPYIHLNAWEGNYSLENNFHFVQSAHWSQLEKNIPFWSNLKLTK